MNIAFPAFVLLLLLMPGIVFHRLRSPKSSFKERRPLADEIGLSVVATVFLQSLWYALCWALSPFTSLVVDLRSTVVILSGRFGTSDEVFTTAVDSFAQHSGSVFFYFVSLLLFSAVSGITARYIARPFRQIKHICFERLHERLPHNCTPLPWGTSRSALELSESIDSRDEDYDEPGNRRFGQWMRACEIDEETRDELGNFVLLLIVAAVVELGGKPFLFKGILDKAFFGPDGELERMSLSQVARRRIHEDETDERPAPQLVNGDTSPRHEYYTVVGDTFILRMSEVKTINLLYYAIQPPNAGE